MDVAALRILNPEAAAYKPSPSRNNIYKTPPGRLTHPPELLNTPYSLTRTGQSGTSSAFSTATTLNTPITLNMPPTLNTTMVFETPATITFTSPGVVLVNTHNTPGTVQTWHLDFIEHSNGVTHVKRELNGVSGQIMGDLEKRWALLDFNDDDENGKIRDTTEGFRPPAIRAAASPFEPGNTELLKCENQLVEREALADCQDATARPTDLNKGVANILPEAFGAKWQEVYVQPPLMSEWEESNALVDLDCGAKGDIKVLPTSEELLSLKPPRFEIVQRDDNCQGTLPDPAGPPNIHGMADSKTELKVPKGEAEVSESSSTMKPLKEVWSKLWLPNRGESSDEAQDAVNLVRINGLVYGFRKQCDLHIVNLVKSLELPDDEEKSKLTPPIGLSESLISLGDKLAGLGLDNDRIGECGQENCLSAAFAATASNVGGLLNNAENSSSHKSDFVHGVIGAAQQAKTEPWWYAFAPYC